MTYTTLTYNEIEKALADWDITAPYRNQQNQAKDRYTFTVEMPADGNPPFPYDCQISIQIGRIAATTNPTNATLPQSGCTSFSGGEQHFWGYALEPKRIGKPGEERLEYTLIGCYERFFGDLTFQEYLLTYSPTLGKQIAYLQSTITLGLSLTTLYTTSGGSTSTLAPKGTNGDTVTGTTATNLLSIGQQVKMICMYAQNASASEAAINGLGWPSGAQFNCDALTNAVDSVGFDLLETPLTNALIQDFAGTAVSGYSTNGTLPAGSYILRAPLDTVNAITCADAIQRQLQWLGGIGSPVVWIDHTQTPPQLHCATRDQLTAVSLPFSGITVEQDIQRRSDLIPNAVHFKYKVSGTNLDQPYNVVIDDIAAYLTAEGAPGVAGAPGVSLYEGIGAYGQLESLAGTAFSSGIQAGLLVAAARTKVVTEQFDLQGTNVSAQSCKISTSSIASALTSASDSMWLYLFPELKNVSGLAFYNSDSPSVVIVDAVAGTSYYSAGAWAATQYVNAVVDGQIAPWMLASGGTPANPVAGQTVKATITVRFTYTQNAEGPSGSGAFIGKVNYHEKNITVTLTTLTSGTYYNTPSIQFGEPVPYGLAGYYCYLESIPQYEGRITVQETEISDVCPIGSMLNITGSRSEWTAMNATVQDVEYDYDKGQTHITFGPGKHLGGGEFARRFVTNCGPRWFLTIQNNYMNSTPSGGNSLGNNMPAQAPSSGGQSFSFQKFLGDMATAQTSPDSTHLDKGIYHNGNGDWGGETAPSITSSTPEIIVAAGGTANPYSQLDVTPKLKLQASSTAGTSAVLDGFAAKLTLTSGAVVSFLDYEELKMTSGANSADLVPTVLTITNGSDSISINIADIAGLGEAFFQALIFCQAGVNYTAKFLMTTPVAT